jgi:hypothetical protein
LLMAPLTADNCLSNAADDTTNFIRKGCFSKIEVVGRIR